MIEINDIESLIKKESQIVSENFSNISLNGFVEKFSFIIDKKKLDLKYLNEVNITLDGDLSPHFKNMMEYDKFPALYFFEINESIEKGEIINLIKNANEKNTLNIPSQNSTSNNQGVLYVGKVKSCAWGRLIQHLGYHKNRKSHGLQLDFWAKESKIELNLKYTVMFFEKEMADEINVLERILAKKLNPIIGKH